MYKDYECIRYSFLVIRSRKVKLKSETKEYKTLV